MSKQAMLMRAASMVALLLALIVPLAASAKPVDSLTAPAGKLLDVEVQVGDGGPVVTLAGDRQLEYESFVLDAPYRLVVDLPGVMNRLDHERFAVDSGGVVQIRAAQFRLEPLPVSRIVFDLDLPMAYEIQSHGSELVITFGDSAGAPEWVTAEALPEWTRQQWSPDAIPIEAAAQPPTPAPLAGEAEVDTSAVAMQATDEAEAIPEPEPTPVAEVLDSAGASPPAAPPEAARGAGEEGSSAREAAPAAREAASGSIQSGAIERLLETPPLAAEAPEEEPGSPRVPSSFQTRTIVTDQVQYVGKRISLNLVDADVKQVFRLFHEISGINFVLDPSVSGRVTIVVDNVPWDQALDLILKNNGLDKVLENNVIRIASTQKLAQEAAQRKQLKEAKELEVEPITITRTLSYAKAKDVERVIREGGVLTQRGKVIVDERTNTLIISDIPKKVEPLDQLITTLDAETPQVMIEARVVETSRDFVRDLGVVWGFNAIADASRGTQTGLPFPNNAAVRYDLNLPGAGAASQLAFSFGNILDSVTLDIALNTLETEGHARVLSAPKVATQNNERAEIEQGVRIPVVNTTATEINVEFVAASLRLEVTPQITAEGTIILDIVVENNSPDFVNRVDDVPPINTQRAQTKVMIEDGGTTVIGGIFSINEGRSETGVPWFRKIPLFGWLFKTQNITQQNRELLIFITPKILKLG